MLKNRSKLLVTSVIINDLFILITLSFVIIGLISQIVYGVEMFGYPTFEITNFIETQDAINNVYGLLGHIVITFFVALLSIIYSIFLSVGFTKNNKDLMLVGLVFQMIFTIFALISWFDFSILIILLILLLLNIFGYMRNNK